MEQNRSKDLKEGKKLCDDDLAEKDKESQLIGFKKQIFAQEMKSAWEKQNTFRKTLTQIEEMF